MESKELSQQLTSAFDAQIYCLQCAGPGQSDRGANCLQRGFVMPSAIGLRTRVAISRRPERKLLIQSQEFPPVLRI